MKNLDFELGRKLDSFVNSIATDTGADTDTVYTRLQELLGEANSNSIVNSNSRAIGRKSPVFVVGSKVHPRHKEVIALSKKGLTGQQIVDKTGVSRFFVYKILSQGKPTRTERPLNSKPGERLERIRELAKSGLTTVEIAAKVGITNSGVSYQARKYGIEIKRAAGYRNPWEGMTPEERSKEMRRRRELASSGQSKEAPKDGIPAQ